MIFTALGGGHHIGGSCYVLELAGKKLICDCGIAFGKFNVPIFPDLSDLGHIDAIFVTHGHLDHIGALPLLARQYPEVPIFTSKITFELISVMLTDNLNFNRRADRPSRFDETDLLNLLGRIKVIDHNQWFSPWIDWEIKFWPAGHIPGAVSVLIKTADHTAMFSGDLSFYGDAVVAGAVAPDDFHPQLLITEATNGHLQLPNRQAEEALLCAKVTAVLNRGGHVLIPALAVGRCSQIALTLARAGFKVNLGGGLPIRVLDAYRASHANIRLIGKDEHSFDALAGIATASEPQLVVATQGMMEGGISRDLAYHWGENPKNAILLPGFQAEETTGERFLRLRSGETFTFHDRHVSATDQSPVTKVILAEVMKFHISSHPDGPQLTSWIKTLEPQTTIMTHGTMRSFNGLQHYLEQATFRNTVRIGYNGRPIEA